MAEEQEDLCFCRVVETIVREGEVLLFSGSKRNEQVGEKKRHIREGKLHCRCLRSQRKEE